MKPTLTSAALALAVGAIALLAIAPWSGAVDDVETVKRSHQLASVAERQLGNAYGCVIDQGELDGKHLLLTVTRPRALPAAWRVARRVKTAHTTSLKVVPRRHATKNLRLIANKKLRPSMPDGNRLTLATRGHRCVILVWILGDQTDEQRQWVEIQQRRWDTDIIEPMIPEPGRPRPD